jgi:hypothetical protein
LRSASSIGLRAGREAAAVHDERGKEGNRGGLLRAARRRPGEYRTRDGRHLSRKLRDGRADFVRPAGVVRRDDHHVEAVLPALPQYALGVVHVEVDAEVTREFGGLFVKP